MRSYLLSLYVLVEIITDEYLNTIYKYIIYHRTKHDTNEIQTIENNYYHHWLWEIYTVDEVYVELGLIRPHFYRMRHIYYTYKKRYDKKYKCKTKYKTNSRL